MTRFIMLASPRSDALNIPSIPVALTLSMLHAPGLAGAAAAGMAEMASAANVDTTPVAVISLFLISFLLWSDLDSSYELHSSGAVAEMTCVSLPGGRR